MASLNDPTVFPVACDPDVNPKCAWGWRTVIQSPESGKEIRSGLRNFPVRRLEFTAVFEDQIKALQFRGLWRSAAERLRFYVPLWPFRTQIESIVGSTVNADTRARGFIENSRALIWRSETDYELIDFIDAVTDGSIVAHDPIADDDAAGALLIPVMTAWLAPPSVDLLSLDVESVPLVFYEEVAGIAGIDPTIGLSEVPNCTTLLLDKVDTGSPWAGRKFSHLRAYAFDAAGVWIRGAAIEWTITPSGSDGDDPNIGGGVGTRVGITNGGQDAYAEYVDGTNAGYSVHAECGAGSVDGQL